MFLVDVGERILSTDVVPPRQKEREVRKISSFPNILMELFDIVVGLVEGFPMDWKQAAGSRSSGKAYEEAQLDVSGSTGLVHIPGLKV
ncbi:hypothetical protein GGS26DRAFT_592335 [Hypomontagnella submonticulosa]|nr:hypothetical protein GGS26DRAFT_592335 [Hypomontagnella submonticulosa]